MKPRDLILVVALVCAGGTFALAQQAAVPVMVRTDGDMDTCGVGTISEVTAVRAGPGIGHRQIDGLTTGARVWMFDEKDDWVGVAYGSENIECSPIKQDKAYDGPGKSGWVHRKFVRLIAG